MSTPQVLIVDDEPELAELLTSILVADGYDVITSHTGRAARARLEQGFAGVVLLDVHLPDADGLDLIVPLSAEDSRNRVVVMTGDRSASVGLEATKRGAYDFIVKGDDLSSRLLVTLKNAFRDLDMTAQMDSLSRAVNFSGRLGTLLAQSPQMNRVFSLLRRALESRVTVLIEGESGTGKELVARALHTEGRRAAGPFVAVNCAGIPETLLESELFGHERGAFTGAVSARKGKFELAEGGTLFLDEIGEMAPLLQAKILRALETRTIERLGGQRSIPVDVRVVSASNRELDVLVKKGSFREDLFYRLAVFPIKLPPLRMREGDIPLLARHFLRLAASEEGKFNIGLSTEALAVLERYPYPGNIRELRNIISRAVVVAEGNKVMPADLPPHLEEVSSPDSTQRMEMLNRGLPEPLDQRIQLLFPSPQSLPKIDDLELAVARQALELHGGNMMKTAESLGIARATLYRWLKRDGGRDQLS